MIGARKMIISIEYEVNNFVHEKFPSSFTRNVPISIQDVYLTRTEMVYVSCILSSYTNSVQGSHMMLTIL